MEPKCNYCDFFGEKYHCGNCKIFKGEKKSTPREITCSLEEFVESVEKTDNLEDLEEMFGIGDYIYLDTYTGERLKAIVLDYGKDVVADSNGAKAKMTLGVMDVDGAFSMNSKEPWAGGYRASLGRSRMDRFYRILPKALREHIQPVEKQSTIDKFGKEICTTKDKLWMFSSTEIFGSISQRVGEGEQYEYFQKPANRRLSKMFFLRTSSCDGTDRFCATFSRGILNFSSSSTLGIAFGFCLGKQAK